MQCSWKPRSSHSYALAVNVIHPHPTVDATAVVANLEPLSLPGLDEVEILRPIHLAEDDVAYLKFVGTHRRHRAQLTGVNLARHRIPTRTKLDGFAFPQPVNVGC